ncbi:MAG: hypothetical protein FWH48_03375 [Oscillospiraceae bacterium]|nr:hypothetical protein [Oscillospiraceae bacterium]
MFDKPVHDELKRKNKAFALAISLLVAIFSAVRIILTRFYIHEEIHFYTENAGALVMSVDYIIAACVVSIYFVSFFVYKRRLESHNYSEVTDCFVQGTQSQVFSAWLTGFLFVATAIFQVYSFFFPLNSDTAYFQSALPLLDRLFAYVRDFPLDFFIFFASLTSAVYFFKTAALSFDAKGSSEEKYSSAHIVFSFMPIIWSFLNIFKCFFDMSKNVNSPVRIYELLSFLALSTYFVSESRILVGKRETSRFFTFAYISLLLVFSSSLPNLIWSSFWILSTNSDPIIYATQLAVATYIFSRIYSQIKYSKFLLQR